MNLNERIAELSIDEADAEGLALSPGGRGVVKLTDFWAVMTEHKYICTATRDLWPAASVNGRIPNWPKGPKDKPIRPSDWLDRNRAVDQVTWAPGQPEVVEGSIIADGGWIACPGRRVYNLYRPPMPPKGNPGQAGPWREHLRAVYPDEAEHIERWLAHRVQRPGEKLNHALVLGGWQGVGKDTLLEPAKRAVGPWNVSEISPAQMLGRFNGWVKAVIVRVSEARDLGDVDRFAFYDHSKTFIAAPPDVLRVDEKNLREHAVPNVCGLIITTNHRTDGIYLPADDRRHFVAWSERTKDDFDTDYWRGLWGWYEEGGYGHVAAFLQALDLSGFDPKAPPPKTSAFWAIVQANHAPEDSELSDVIERAGNPEALTLQMVVANAEASGMHELAGELKDRRQRRSVPHKLERAGYVAIPNPDATSGLWRVRGNREVVYCRREMSIADQIRAARRLQETAR